MKADGLCIKNPMIANGFHILTQWKPMYFALKPKWKPLDYALKNRNESRWITHKNLMIADGLRINL